MTTNNPEEFARLTAIVVHALIHKDVEKNFPDMSAREKDGVKLSIIERVALMRGYTLKLNGGRVSLEDDD